MANKNKQNNENDKAAEETWRKPLQVPSRTNAMRSFYRAGDEESVQAVREENSTDAVSAAETRPAKTVPKANTHSAPQKSDREKVEAESQTEETAPQPKEPVFDSNAKQANKLTKEDLSRHLGFEIDDLFDIHELLRGKSFDIYQALLQSRDENGRCKITQPELMKRTGIKNRRTFYKHEEWLINLKLLEKRHLPGDHKGVVYRVFEASNVLPLPTEMLNKFTEKLKSSE